MDENNQQTTDTGADASQVQDQVDDWGSATADFLADKGVKVDEQANAEKTDEEKAAEAANSDGKKSDEGEGAGDDSKEQDEKTDPNADENLEQQADDGAPYREARQVQREIEADRSAMKTDIQKEMYSDWSDDILDADGEPLKTPRDVMSHINPVTGKRFTEEEATAWLFEAQKHKDKERTERDQRIEHVADVMIQQRDDADVIRTKYGKLLAKLPDLRKEIWADYKDTLVIDKESGLIVDAPVSLAKFFERALKPYADYAAQLQANAGTTQKSAQDEQTRKQTQADRQDITSVGSGTVTDAEEQGWADAAKQYYEGK